MLYWCHCNKTPNSSQNYGEFRFIGYICSFFRLILSQRKSLKSCTVYPIPNQLKVHSRKIIIHTYLQFYDIPFVGYLVIRPEGWKNGWMYGQIDGWILTELYPSASAGIHNNSVTRIRRKICRGNSLKFRCMRRPTYYSAIFYKEVNFGKFLFAFLDDETFPK